MEISEDKQKEILIEQSDEFKRYVDSLIAKNCDEFRRFIEHTVQHVAQREHQKTRHLFSIMKEDIDCKMEHISEQYSTIKKMVSALAVDMQTVKADIEYIKEVIR